MRAETIRELVLLARSSALRKDMKSVAAARHNPFIKNGEVDADAYIEFVTQYNEFINHQPKPFIKMIDRRMKL